MKGPTAAALATLLVGGVSATRFTTLEGARPSDSTVADVSLANFLAQEIGQPLVRPASRAASEAMAEQTEDVWNRPRASVLFVTSDDASHDADLFADSTVSIESAGEPDNIAEVSTLLTGTKRNGVFGRMWLERGRTLNAFDNDWSSRHEASIYDLAAQSSKGRALVVSASADGVMAEALGVSPALDRRSPSGNYQVLLGSVASGNELQMSEHDFYATLDRDIVPALRTADLSVERDGSQLIVGEQSFDLSDAADARFFSEWAFSFHVARTLDQARVDRTELGERVSDGVADMYQFAMSGVDSDAAETAKEQFKAITLQPILMRAATAKFDEAYGTRRVASHWLRFKSHTLDQQARRMQLTRLVDALARRADSTVNETDTTLTTQAPPTTTTSLSHFPTDTNTLTTSTGDDPYLGCRNPRSRDRDAVCSNVGECIDHSCHCGEVYVGDFCQYNTYSIEHVTLFQIEIWGSALAVVIVLVTGLSLFYIKYDDDSLLFSASNAALLGRGVAASAD